MADKRKELLANRVKDFKINGKTTISDFVSQCNASGGKYNIRNQVLIHEDIKNEITVRFIE